MKRALGLCLGIAAGLLAGASPAPGRGRLPAVAALSGDAPRRPPTIEVEQQHADDRRGRRRAAPRACRPGRARAARHHRRSARRRAAAWRSRSGDEGYLVRSAEIGGQPTVVVTAEGERGLLYGAFALLRASRHAAARPRTIDLAVRARASSCACSTTGTISTASSSAATPAARSGTGGRCPTTSTRATPTTPAPTPRSASTARCVNNVNAKADSLTAAYIAKAAALADVFRPYGIRVYLSRPLLARRATSAGCDRRPARPGGARLVGGQGRRDLPRDPRLRRVPGQGQLRRPAGPAGLRPHPRRRRQHARRARSRRTAAW